MAPGRLGAIAGAFVLVLGHLASLGADACSCLDRPLCDDISFASVVLRANATQRNTTTDQFADVTYGVDVIQLYKSEANVTYSGQITFTTPGSSALCGVFLDLGEEYLLDLTRSETDGGLSAVGICGAIQSWASVTEDDLSTLEHGCVNDLIVAETSADESAQDEDNSSFTLRPAMRSFAATASLWLASFVASLFWL